MIKRRLFCFVLFCFLCKGGRIVPRFEDVSAAKLGKAGSVREVSVGTNNEQMIMIEGVNRNNSCLICGVLFCFVCLFVCLFCLLFVHFVCFLCV
jgi:hypothetical protein